jgi:DNA-binding response OmpR family regulator
MVQSTAAMTTVLVVEDDPTVAELVRAVINDVPGWGAIVAYDGRAALGLLEHVPVDVLVLDVMLPGMSGIELLAELRRRPEWYDPPVIMMSANVSAQAIEKALGRDAFLQFLPKPFDIDDLLGAISLALECRAQSREEEREEEQLGGLRGQNRPSQGARVS